MSALISAVVCTYNRCESLRDTLRSLMQQQLRENISLEIVIVDNNSSDRTKDVVTEVAHKTPWPIKYIFERRQGKSYALNTGIRHAEGEALLFLDDDVITAPDWAQAMWTCLNDTRCDVVAGKIEMLWNCERPVWLADELHGPLISQDLGPVRRLWEWKSRYLLGANMAFRRNVFDRVGLFQEELGRKAESLVAGEDKDIFDRLVREGGVIYYEPSALVWHKVEPQRVSKPYLQKWYLDTGRTLGHQFDWRWHYRLTVAPIWVWLQAARVAWRFCVSHVQHSSESERFASKAWVLFNYGLLEERVYHWFPLNLGAAHCAVRNR